MQRTERDKSFEVEQYINRVYALQQELLESRDETRKQVALLEKSVNCRLELEEAISLKTEEIEQLKEEIAKLKEGSRRHRDEATANARVIDVLNQELDELRRANLTGSRFGSRTSVDNNNLLIAEMDFELKSLKSQVRDLKETNEELTAQLLTTRLGKRSFCDDANRIN